MDYYPDLPEDEWDFDQQETNVVEVKSNVEIYEHMLQVL